VLAAFGTWPNSWIGKRLRGGLWIAPSRAWPVIVLIIWMVVGHNMSTLLSLFIPLCWLVWATIWFIAAQSVKKTERREDDFSRLANSAPLLIAGILLALPRHWLGFFGIRWFSHGMFIGTAIVVVGLGFAIWARYSLGSNWSGVITVKEDHALVRSGPYALVRHPI
jgi:hypothetical protein